jgi:glycosyltransferase involved in cell wall biosynthesis
MQIAFIAGEYPPMQGGVGDFTHMLGKEMVAHGHAVLVITLAQPHLPRETTENGMTIIRCISRWGWSTFGQIRQVFQTHYPDVVNLQYQAAAYHMHGAINLLPAQLSKIVKTVVTFHDLRVPYLFPKAGHIRWLSILHMARHAHGVIVTNPEDEQTLRKERIMNICRIPIGSNITPSSLVNNTPSAWKKEHNIDPHLPLVGYFGFMNESKGGETLIRAMAILNRRRPVGLLLIGGQHGASDPTNIAYANHLNQLIDEFGLRELVFSTGFLNDTEVSSALRACECLALPYRDGVSFRRGTLMAALAHGCAIVSTTPQVSLPEVIHELNMLIVPPDQADALAGAIERVLSELPLKEKLQINSLKLSQSFEWSAIAKQSVDFMRR